MIALLQNNSFEYLKNKTININELANLPLLVLTKGAINRIRLDDFCVQNNITIKPEMEFGSNTLIKEFTETGFGIGMLTKEHVKEEIANGSLFEIKTNIDINPKHLSLLYNTDYKRNITKKFIEYIKNN